MIIASHRNHETRVTAFLEDHIPESAPKSLGRNSEVIKLAKGYLAFKQIYIHSRQEELKTTNFLKF